MMKQENRALQISSAVVGGNAPPYPATAVTVSGTLPYETAPAALAQKPSNLRFMPAALEQFVEAAEAAPFVRLSERHLKQLAREGKVPAHPRGDGQRRRWLFLLSELDAWMRRRVNSACDPCRA